MITWIDVRNFLIVRHVEISFDSGLTVITGETGAGKSIIVDALTIPVSYTHLTLPTT